MYISVPATVLIVFAIFKIFFPHKERLNVDEKRLLMNRRKYSLYEGFSIIPIFVFFGFTAYLVYLLGNFIIGLLSAEEDVLFQFRPTSEAWLFPGSVFAIGFMAFLVELLYKVLLKDEYPLYLEFTNRKHGFNARKIFFPIFFMLSVAGVLIFVKMLNVSLTVTEGKIVVTNLFSVTPSQVAIPEIKQVVFYKKIVAPNGNIVDKEHFVFYNGTGDAVFNTDKQLYEVEKRFIDYILEENNLQITNVEVNTKE